jgi:hypothetical protein
MKEGRRKEEGTIERISFFLIEREEKKKRKRKNETTHT